MLVIWKRELRGYLQTPIGYVFIGFFLLVGGVMFTFTNLAAGSGSIANMLAQFTTILLFLVPVLTMRLFSEERKNKSEQLLLTSPVSLVSIVVGKFLAAVTIFFLTLAVTWVYVLIIGFYGKIYWGETVTAYLGFFLMGCAYIAAGVFVSAMTENQVSAAVATYGLNFFLWVMDAAIYLIPVRIIADILSWLSIFKRYEVFTQAQLGFSGILYFLSFTAVFLFLAVRVIDSRRWSEG